MTKKIFSVIACMLAITCVIAKERHAISAYEVSQLSDAEEQFVEFIMVFDPEEEPPLTSRTQGPVTLEFGQADGFEGPRGRPEYLMFKTGCTITFSISQGYYISKIIFEKNKEGKFNESSFCTPAVGKIERNDGKVNDEWTCQEDRPTSFTLQNGTEKNDGQIRISKITVCYAPAGSVTPLEKAPAPSLLKYNNTDNTVFLTVLRPDGTTVENATILYCFTYDNTTPTDCNEVYNEYINLGSVASNTGICNLWAKSHIEGFDDSNITLIQSFKIYDGSIVPGITYRAMTHGQDLIVGHWYIITAYHEGILYALGATSDDLTAKQLNCEPGTINATINEFNQLGITEYTFNDQNQLIEKDSGNPLKCKAPLSRSEQSVKLTIDTNDNHILTVDGIQLGFDGNNFGFGPEYPLDIKLYTTGTDKNTGICNIITDDTGVTQPEYYNMQGIKIPAPTRTGIYIKKQGNKTSKVIIR